MVVGQHGVDGLHDGHAEEEDGGVGYEAELLAPLDPVERTKTLWQSSGTDQRGEGEAAATATMSGGDELRSASGERAREARQGESGAVEGSRGSAWHS